MDTDGTITHSIFSAYPNALSSSNFQRITSLGSIILTLASIQMPSSTPGPSRRIRSPPMSSPFPSSLPMRKLEIFLSSLISTPRCVLFPHTVRTGDSNHLFFLSINQCCSFSSMHPPSPINLGEAWTKSIYEAIRSSPQWENILFLITFDEHGVRKFNAPLPYIADLDSSGLSIYSTGFFWSRLSSCWRP